MGQLLAQAAAGVAHASEHGAARRAGDVGDFVEGAVELQAKGDHFAFGRRQFFDRGVQLLHAFAAQQGLERGRMFRLRDLDLNFECPDPLGGGTAGAQHGPRLVYRDLEQPTFKTALRLIAWQRAERGFESPLGRVLGILPVVHHAHHKGEYSVLVAGEQVLQRLGVGTRQPGMDSFVVGHRFQ